ncbi:ADP-ribose pyrophosphatase [Pseudobythopirellula maris]|uniref:GDP-mannose pyrophosphatase n=1 Tax=Pseudobythopirellula maris TaxID=2527991 RepID=A0A5C5ZTX7_9BACT|nr:NUDIX hydrolase [Pseudobythopirellula maris]TWT90321.1 ADP-ribose pyrophosphatase [Pseudobythopirellula maris]
MEEKNVLLETSRFRVVERLQTTASGDERPRQVVEHPGAVVILPLLAGGRVCLIRNRRIAVDDTLLELPAGTLEPPEPPIECARRELIEETGYRAGRIEPTPPFWMSPGILSERMHAFVAQDLSEGPAAREPGEEIENHIVPLSEALAMCHDGRIEDAKTLVMLLRWAATH